MGVSLWSVQETELFSRLVWTVDGMFIKQSVSIIDLVIDWSVEKLDADYGDSPYYQISEVEECNL